MSRRTPCTGSQSDRKSPRSRCAFADCREEDTPSVLAIARRTPIHDLPEFLSVEEFYTYTGISRSTAYDLLRRGEIPHRRFGRRIVIPKTALTGVE